jgi:RNA polymerase sigma-70 factor, ECF subfamily
VAPGVSGTQTPGAVPDQPLELGPSFAAPYGSGETSGSDFAAIYRQYVSAVYSYFYHQVSNIPDAEDLTATAFSTALASFGRYQTSRGSLAAWLFGVARNCLRDHRRHPHTAERLERELPDWQPLPELQLLSAERAMALHEAIGHLPSDQREALALRFFGELRTRDVAAVLGKSEGAIKMLVRRAVLTLRDRSEREGWR